MGLAGSEGNVNTLCLMQNCSMAGGPETKSRDSKDAVIQKSSNVNIEKAAMGAVDIDAKITVYVCLACLVAASGGVLFGECAPFLQLSFILHGVN